MPDNRHHSAADEFVVTGQLLRNAHGQASFRIAAAACGTCRSCQASRSGEHVRDIVIESAVVLHGAISDDLATHQPVQACLFGSRCACRRAASVLYGLPLAGMVLGVLAMDLVTGAAADSERLAIGAALMGMLAGAALARWLATVPEVALRMDSRAATHVPQPPDDSGRPR